MRWVDVGVDGGGNKFGEGGGGGGGGLRSTGYGLRGRVGDEFRVLES